MITDHTPVTETHAGDWERGYAKGYARALQQVTEQLEFKVGSDRQYSTDARWVMDQVYEVVEMLRKLDDHD